MKKQKIKHKILSNGIPVLYEVLPQVRSVSFKVLVNVGSRHESDSQRGMAHFIEHMMFKGTPTRSAFDIANSIERFGGHFNAYTSKEETVYLAKVVDSQLSSTIDTFYDMLNHSSLDAEEIEQEKGVVIEEVNGTYDAPDDIIWDYFNENLLNPDDAGKPTLGTKSSVRSFTRDGLHSFWKTHYNASNMIIAAAGHLDEEEFINKLEATFANVHKTVKTQTSFIEPQNIFDKSFKREIEQIHLLIGKKICQYSHEDRLNLIILNNILGGGMSSRLFQNIREKHGFAYQVFSAMDFLSDHGVAYNYIASDSKNYQSSVDLTLKEISDLKNGHLSEEDVENAKTQLKGALLLSMENNAQRVDKMMRHYIRFNEFFDIDQLIQKIDDLSLSGVRETAEHYFDPNSFSIAKIGALT